MVVAPAARATWSVMRPTAPSPMIATESPRRMPDASDRPDGHLGRLDERGLVVTDRIGKPDAGPARNLDVLRETAVAVEADRGPRDAQRVLVAAAIPAFAAEQADLRCNAVADGQPFDARPDRHHLAGELVPERDRGLLAGERVRVVDGDDDGAVAVLLEVGPADAAPAHAKKNLPGADGRDGDVVDPDIAATVPPCGAHRAGHPAVPSCRRAPEADPASITGTSFVVCGNPEVASSPCRAVDGTDRPWARPGERRPWLPATVPGRDTRRRRRAAGWEGRPMTVSVGQATLELVADARATLGEGPVWDETRGVLWWVDVTAGLVRRFDPRTGEDRAIDVGSPVGSVVLRRDGTLLAALAGGIAALEPGTGRLETIVRLDSEGGRIRCNDGKCDEAGRFWVGRMALDAAPGAGLLLRVDADLTVSTHLLGLAIPNGLGWSPDGRRMYFIDSTWREVRAFAYDPRTGMMGDGRVLVGFPGDGSVPDGMTVDEAGHLWVARWGGSSSNGSRPTVRSASASSFPSPASRAAPSAAATWATSTSPRLATMTPTPPMSRPAVPSSAAGRASAARPRRPSPAESRRLGAGTALVAETQPSSGTTGSPAADHASNPPTTSPTLANPRSCRVAAARLDEKPWAQMRMTGRAGSDSAGSS